MVNRLNLIVYSIRNGSIDHGEGQGVLFVMYTIHLYRSNVLLADEFAFEIAETNSTTINQNIFHLRLQKRL